MKQLVHQDSGTACLQKFTSNPGLLLPKTALWFRLSWGDLIIMTLIMVLFVFNFKSTHLNLPMNLLYILAPIEPNQLMMMKWATSWNYYTHIVMKIFGCQPPDASGLTSGFSFFKRICGINCLDSKILRINYICHKFHVTLFYICPDQHHCEIG